MKKIIAIAIIGMVLSAVFVGIDFSQAEERLGTSILKGYVTDKNTGDPIEGVEIDIWCGDPYYYNYTTTNDTGYYEITGLYEGDYTLYIADPYYMDYFYIAEGETLWFNITLEMPLPEDSEIHGYVTEQGAKGPIKDLYISINGEDANGDWYWNFTYTDEDGYYSLNVPVGDFYLTFYGDDLSYYNHVIGAYINESETDYPLDVELMAKQSESNVLKGHVYGSDGKALEDAYIELNGMDGNGYTYYNDTYTDENGYYEMNLPDFRPIGTWAWGLGIRVERDPYKDVEGGIYVPEIEGRAVVVQDFTLLARDAIIDGTVIDSTTGLPIDGAEVLIEGYDVDGDDFSEEAYTNATGGYRIEAYPGEYTIYAWAENYYSSVDLEIEINGGETEKQNFSLDPADAVIKGIVRDNSTNDAIENAYVEVVGTDSNGHEYQIETSTNITGYYEFSLPSGDYILYAYADDYYTSYIELQISQGQVLVQDLYLNHILPENCVVYGYVYENNTRATGLEGIDVYIDGTDAMGDEFSNYTSTDKNGYYEMNVRAGDYTIYCTDWGEDYYDSDEIELHFESGDAVQQDFYLDPIHYAMIYGYVTNDGEPIAGGIQVWLWGTDIHGGYVWKGAYTDKNGYYQTRIPEGSYNMQVDDAWEVGKDKYRGLFETEPINVSSGESVQKDITLELYPPLNNILNGKVIDADTQEPIPNAMVTAQEVSESLYRGYMYDYTIVFTLYVLVSAFASGALLDDSAIGFYETPLFSGAWRAYASAEGYFNSDEVEFSIGGTKEEKTINFELTKMPPMNSKIYGYVYDAETQEPLKDGWVTIEDTEHNYEQVIWCDDDGYYETEIYAGTFEITATAEGYVDSTKTVTIAEYEEKQQDFYLNVETPSPDLIATGISPLTAEVNEETEFTITVRNQGTEDIAEPFKVRVEIDEAKAVEIREIDALDAGAETTVNISWTFTSEGEHTMNVFVDSEDVIEETDEGNNWLNETIAVTTPDITAPEITVIYPKDGDTIPINQPNIRADYSDTQSGINIASVVMEVDEQTVTPDVVSETGVAYTTEPLSDGLHTVYLEVSDNAGNTASKAWSFTVNTSMTDTDPPFVTDLKPANGSIVLNPKPEIGASYSDASGIDVESVILKVDDEDVTGEADITYTEIKYIPPENLTDGVHRVELWVSDLYTTPNTAYVNWTFTVNTTMVDITPPEIFNTYPEGTVATASPIIGAEYYDPEPGSGIDTSSVKLELDGVVKTPTEITESSITYESNNLEDGVHEVYVEVYDFAGNFANVTWNFTVDTSIVDTTPPEITDLNPPDGTLITSASVTISASYSDESTIDTSRVVLKVDDVDVTAQATVTPTEITYQANLEDGVHTVYLEVWDKAETPNMNSKTWTFTVNTSIEDITPPTITNVSPKDGSTVFTSTPTISAEYSDDYGVNINAVILKLNGDDVTAQATVTPTEITYIPTHLDDGDYIVYLEVSDYSGNMNSTTWSFTVDTSVQLSVEVKVSKSDPREDEKITITAKVTNAGTRDADVKVILYIDDNDVESKTVTVPAGSSVDVVFTWKAKGVKAHTVKVSVEFDDTTYDDSTTVNVKEKEKKDNMMLYAIIIIVIIVIIIIAIIIARRGKGKEYTPPEMEETQSPETPKETEETFQEVEQKQE